MHLAVILLVLTALLQLGGVLLLRSRLRLANNRMEAQQRVFGLLHDTQSRVAEDLAAARRDADEAKARAALLEDAAQDLRDHLTAAEGGKDRALDQLERVETARRFALEDLERATQDLERWRRRAMRLRTQLAEARGADGVLRGQLAGVSSSFDRLTAGLVELKREGFNPPVVYPAAAHAPELPASIQRAIESRIREPKAQAQLQRDVWAWLAELEREGKESSEAESTVLQRILDGADADLFLV